MVTMRKTITIPHTMEAWIKARVEGGQYANDSEYLRDLIRRDQEKAAAEAELRALIEQGLDSGISTASKAQIRDRVEARLRADGDI